VTSNRRFSRARLVRHRRTAVVAALVFTAALSGCKPILGVGSGEVLAGLQSDDRDTMVEAVRDVPYVRGIGRADVRDEYAKVLGILLVGTETSDPCPHELVRQVCAETLGRRELRCAVAAEALTQALIGGDRSHKVRKDAAASLAAFEYDVARLALMKALKEDSDVEVRAQCARSLESHPSLESAMALVDVLRGTPAPVTVQAQVSLERMLDDLSAEDREKVEARLGGDNTRNN
jgi:hypothetical protein